VNTNYDCVSQPTLGLAAGSISVLNSLGVKGTVLYGSTASGNIGQNCNPPYPTAGSNLGPLFQPYCQSQTDCTGSYLGQYSSALASAPATGVAQVSYGTNMVLYPSGAANQFFNIDSSQLSGVTNINLDTDNVTSSTVFYITVTGSSVSLSGGGNLLTTGSGFAPRTLWNFPTATTLSIGVSLQGSVIAPCATLTTNGGGNVEGDVFANNWVSSGNLQLHNVHVDCTIFTFIGPPAPSTVPLPSPNPSPSPSPTPSPQVQSCSPVYGQCGGIGWSGPTCCQSNSVCVVSNPYYSQCIPSQQSKQSSSSSTVTTSVALSAVLAVLFVVGGGAVLVFWKRRKSGSPSNPALPEDVHSAPDLVQVEIPKSD